MLLKMIAKGFNLLTFLLRCVDRLSQRSRTVAGSNSVIFNGVIELSCILSSLSIFLNVRANASKKVNLTLG